MGNKMYELTYPQKNIWLVEKFNGDLPINSIVGSVEIHKNFNALACIDAINHVIKNNDALRLNFKFDGEVTKQFVCDYSYKNFEVVEMSLYSQEEIENYINDFALHPLFFGKNFLFDFKILDYGNNAGAILMKIHHIISDAWSCSKIGTQLVEFIEKINNGEEIEDELKPSYVEYISSEEEYTNSDKYTKDEQFWQDYLSGIEKTTIIKNTNTNISTNANRYSVKLDENFNNKLNEYCKENKISPYVLFLTALSTYIYRIKDNNDLILGTPVLNRSNFKEKNMLGMFVGTLPIRIKVQENIKFLDLAKQIGLNTLTLFRHQKFPYSKTLEYVHRETDIKENLYNIVLSYQNARANLIDKEKYSTTWPFVKHLNEQLQIHIMDMDNTGILNINYDYQTNVFDKIEIEYLHTRLLAIIEDAMKMRDVNIEDIRIMGTKEEEQILYRYNDTKLEYQKDKTVVELFEEQVKKIPDNTALVFNNKEITYKELNERANKVANYLKNIGIGRNDIVAILMKRSFDIMIGILGVLKAGAAYLLVDPEFPENRINYMLENSKSKLTLTNLDYDNNEIKSKVVNINEINTNNIKNLYVKALPDDLFFILYTSGSTGRPKGVQVMNSNMLNLAYYFKNHEIYKNTKVAVSLTTISFDIFIFESLISLLNGVKLVIANEEEQKVPSKLNKLISKYSIDLLQMTPTRFKLLINNIESIQLIKNVKNIVLAGEQLPISLKNKIASWGANVYNGYGPTETTVFASFTNCTDEEHISIGKPLANNKFYILDKKERLLPIGIKGELYIYGAGVSKGYLNNKELTEKSFRNINESKLYKSGDICSINFDLKTYCYGRADNQIKVRGLRIEVSEIQEVIKKEADIKECVVVKQIHNEKEYLIAFITSDKFIDTIQLKKNISKILPLYMVPNIISKIKAMPYTPNGKIDIKRLTISKSYVDYNNIQKRKTIKPTDEIQECIYEYISKINIANYDISIDDNFFEIGLDSLNLMELLIFVNNKYNINLKVADLMQNSTIFELSNIIKNKSMFVEFGNNRSGNIDEIPKYYNLTRSQLRIFSTYTSNPDNVVYNMPIEIKLNRNVDCNKLQKCIEDVINENDAFSLVLRVIDSNIMFATSKSKEKLDCINDVVLDDRYKELREDFVRPFDLLNEKLYRVEIYKTEKNVYILFDVHHIICDGVSLNIVFDEIMRKYNGINTNEKIGSFKQYLLNKENSKNIDEYKEAKTFFNKMFNEGPISTSIKPDHKRIEIRTYNGEKIGIKLKHSTASKLQNYVLSNRITYNTVFLAVLNVLLSKYTYKKDVVLGIATMGRNDLKNNNTIGMFVETLPYKTHITYEDNIKKYLDVVKRDIFNLMKNDIYPIDELITDLSIPKLNNRNALFDIMYVYQNTGLPEISLDGQTVVYNSLLNKVAKFDITFEVIPHGGSFDINIEYNKDLYNKKTIENLLNTYIVALENLLNLPIDENLSCLKIISQKEEEYILNEYNNTKTKTKNRVINKIFEKVVDERPEKIANVYYDKNLSYKELNGKANQIAHMLKENGIGKNDVVALMLDKSIELMPGILGILKTGAAYLPIDYELPDDRIKYMLENSGAKLILTKKEIYREVSKISYCYINFEEELYNLYSKDNLNIDITEEDVAYVIYTSGSTGKPKGVMIPHKGVVRLVRDTNYIHLEENDRVLLSGTIVFDASVFEMWLAMLNGLTLYLIDKDTLLDPTKFEDYINTNNITIALLTTSLFNQLILYKKDLFKNFKYLVSGGDIMNAKSANDVISSSKTIKLINAYGPTENSVISSVYEYKHNRKEKVSIGKPISNSACYIVDEYGNLLPKNVKGELIVGGDGVAVGYINNKELTSERFYKPNFVNTLCYKTGDLAKFDSNYNIDFLGRIDTQVKLRGYRIELDEIKSALFNIEKIKDAYVTIIDNNKGKIESGKLILAYYISDEELDLDYLYNELKKTLPSYMIPNNIIKIDSLPLTINGKIDKSKLPVQVMQRKREIILPRNDIEKKLYTIWQELLPNVEISINDDFFKIGGDSLLATQFVTKSMVNGLKYTYSDIYNYPTIMQLAESNYSLLEEIYGISKYKYNKINELLKTKYYDKISTKQIKDSDFLLTGVTGFLGSHVLANILDNTNSNVYCIVRNKNYRTVRERVKRKLNFFFGNKYDKYIDSRIIVIEGDITKANFGLKNEILYKIQTNVKTVIHVAAMVKHYGNYNKFINLNIGSTEKIANFCLLNNKRLIYISTLSNSGNMLEGGQISQDDIKVQTKYDEKSMYIGQRLYNAYVYSKYMGEYKILRKALNGLEATIIRAGNLTGRYTDGKYQPNVEENAFANRIKSFISLGMIPQDMLNMYVEYTPIDYAAEAIVKISRLEKLPSVIHLFNHNHVYMPDLIKILDSIDINLKVVDDVKFKEIIGQKLKENSTEVNGIISDLNSKKEIKYLSNIIVDSKYSIELLKKLDFKWPEITSEYIIRYLKYLESIDFIKLTTNKRRGVK